MKEMTVRASLEQLDAMQGFLEAELDALDCPAKIKMQIALAAEEIFVNIANYAYGPEGGDATIRFSAETGDDGKPYRIAVTFVDSGIPYNPLERQDPDVTLPAENRKIGGLGVYLVKKTMDGVEYESDGGCNCLTIRKNINSGGTQL
jgi:anti-sigma regulatory factor (Ser/Thr protein kinase)